MKYDIKNNYEEIVEELKNKLFHLQFTEGLKGTQLLLDKIKNLPEIEVSKEITFMLYQAKFLRSCGRTTEAISILEKANNFAVKENLREKHIILIIEMGLAYLKESSFDLSRKLFKEALTESSEYNLDKYLGAIYNYLSNINYILTDYDQALENCQKYLEITQNEKNLKSEANALGNIGTIYERMKNLPMALQFYRDSLKIRKKLHDTLGISMMFNNIGVVCFQQKKYKTAQKYYQKSLDLKKKLNDKAGIARIWHNLGNIYFKTKDFNRSREALQNAFKLRKELNDLFGQTESMLVEVKLNLQEGKISKASRKLTQINKNIKKYDLTDLKKSYLKLKAEIAYKQSKINNYRKYTVLYIKEQERIYSDSLSKKIAKMQTLYQLEKKEKEKEALRLKHLEAEENRAKAELRALKSMVNPHFLFNSINSLISLIDLDQEKAEDMAVNISKLMRYFMISSKKELIPLSEEIEIVVRYVEIELIRFRRKMEFSKEINADLNNIMIPPGICQDRCRL